MSEAIPLAPLQDAVLDPALLSELFTDLSALTQIQEVILKTGAERLAEPGSVGLEPAREALESGQAMAIQIRYLFQGKLWCDTLMRAADGVRLVRTELPQTITATSV